jgi:hypothetical protein
MQSGDDVVLKDFAISAGGGFGGAAGVEKEEYCRDCE